MSDEASAKDELPAIGWGPLVGGIVPAMAGGIALIFTLPIALGEYLEGQEAVIAFIAGGLVCGFVGSI